MRHLAPLRPHEPRRPRSAVRESSAAGPGAGGAGPRSGRPPATPARAGGSTRQAPGPVLRERVAAAGRGAAAASTTELYAGRLTRRGRRPGAPAGLDGGRPARAWTGPARARSTSPCGCAPASRCCSPRSRGGPDERRSTASGWPGWRSAGSPSPGTPGSPAWSPSSAPSRLLELAARPSATSAACAPTSPPGSRRSTPSASWSRPTRLGIRFVVPARRRVAAPARRPRRAPSRSRSAAGAPLGLWVQGPLRLDELRRLGRGGRLAVGDDVRRGRRRRPRRGRGPGRVSRWSPGRRSGSTRRPTAGRSRRAARTVAVLACGVDRAYPTAHQTLLDHLGARGRGRLRGAAGLRADPAALPGPQPADRRAHPRHRGGGGGACAAGRSTPPTGPGRLNRPLMGVPGPVTSAPSQGVHQLIRTGAATLVTSGAEVLELVGRRGRAPRGGAAAARTRPRDRLSLRDQQVLDAVPVARGARADSIARTAGLGLLEVRSALTRLQRARAWSRRRRGRLAARRAGPHRDRRPALPTTRACGGRGA